MAVVWCGTSFTLQAFQELTEPENRTWGLEGEGVELCSGAAEASEVQEYFHLGRKAL